MKQILAFTLIVFSISCNKADKSLGDSLVGEWVRVETYISPGGGGWWNDVQDTPQLHLKFFADGRFSSNYDIYNGYSRYQLKNDTLFFLNQAGERRQHWFSFENQKLTLNYTCICGCGDKFIRSKSAEDFK